MSVLESAEPNPPVRTRAARSAAKAWSGWGRSVAVGVLARSVAVGVLARSVAVGVLAVWAWAALASPAAAYSYAAAGAEPLIDAREATLGALSEKDFDAASQAIRTAAEELRYLDREFGESFETDLGQALEARDAPAVDRIFLRAFAAEVRRRLAAAEEAIADYQRAKTLVVKSKRFYDLLAAALPSEAKQEGGAGLRVCLEAIGNPGVFGVGATDPSPERFAEGRTRVFGSLDALGR